MFIVDRSQEDVEEVDVEEVDAKRQPVMRTGRVS
jgi:hypothetical protein